MALNFKDRVILVTGASRGLGKAYAVYLAELGATVIVNSSGKDSGAAETVESILRSGGQASELPMDVLQGGDLIDAVMAQVPRLDAVIHNAGFVRDSTFAKMSQQDWDAVNAIHLQAAFGLSRAAWPHFRDQSFGRLVFISSAAGLYGNFGQANYAAAKMGLYGLCRTLAVEGKKYDIAVNCVAPFGVTDMNRAMVAEALQAQLKPGNIAPLVAYLCHASCEESGSLFEAGGGRFKKVRWQRSKGLSFDGQGSISLDDIASRWSEISDFSDSDYPEDITQALNGLIMSDS